MDLAKAERETVREAAASWAVRLSDPQVSADTRAAFEAWRGASAAHEAAFEREAAVWDRFDRLRALRPAAPEPDADLLAPRAAAQPVMRWAAAVVGAVALSGIGFATFNASPAYATAVGERRLVVLEDGTRVELNTDSKIVVRYRAGKREVKLVRGEALFEVAPDATRPFVVAARDRRVEADAGAFNVRVQPKAVQVIVAKGAVDIADTTPFGAAHDEAQLAAGVMGLYGEAGGVAQPIAAGRIDQALAWRHGQIALNGQTLEAAVAEFNRYSKDRQLVVADPAIGGYRLGGYFRVDDMAGFVRALQTTFPVKATAEDKTIYLSAAG
ncbi:MAG TPA: FecR domain-containing protein [Caulobacteraceae bacterium]